MSFVYDAAGYETHIASRIEQIAQPGQALLTARTLRLAGGLVLAKPLGACKLRGIETPLDLYELISLSDRPRWDAWVATRPLSRYVGRDFQMQRLAAAARQTETRLGRAVAIRGDAGIGKSRLVHEFSSTSLVRHWTRLRGSATMMDQATPYKLISGLLRAWIGVSGGDDTEVITRKTQEALKFHASLNDDVPALYALLNLPIDDTGWAQSDPQERRRRLLHVIQATFLRESTEIPTLVVLEDLHWADAESLAALDALLDGLTGTKTLIVATGRAEWDPSWQKRDNCLTINLGPLEVGAAQELVSDLLGDGPDLDMLRERLVEECDATPLFMEEMAQMLLDSGIVVRDQTSLRLTHHLDLIHIPDSLQALISERIDRLSMEQREVLEVASVIGRRFLLTVLCDVTGKAENQIHDVLDQLQSMDFVYEACDGVLVEFCFKHALTQMAAYEGMLMPQRRELHARVHDSLKAQHSNRLEEYTEQLAYHAMRAEQWSDALTYLRKAGREANEVSAHDLAIPHFERALIALEHLPTSPENTNIGIDVRLGLRVALAATADLRKIRDCLAEAEVQSTSLGDQDRLALIRASQCTILTLLGELGDATTSGLSARSIARSIGHQGLLISAGFALGQAYSFSGELDKAIAVIAEDLPLILGEMRYLRLGTTGTPSVLCLVSLANSLSLAGDLSDALARAAEARQIASETGRAYDLSYSKVAHGLALLTRGEAAQATEVLEEALMHCLAGKLRILFPSVARFLGQAYIAVGRAGDATKLLEEAVAIASEKGILAFQAWCGVWLGFALLSTGFYERAEKIGGGMLSICQQCGLRPIEAQALRLLGEVHAHKGDNTRALDYFGSAVMRTSQVGMQPEEAQSRLGLGQANLRMGARDAARREFLAATNLFHKLGVIADIRSIVTVLDEPLDNVTEYR
jgi:tetratricopeptide (TPR) repeat protein